MPEITPALLPFSEAIQFFAAKGYALSPDSWRDVWAAEHVRSFTVSRVTSMDVLEDIRGAVRQALKDGVPIQKFRAGISETLARKGWLATPGRPGGPGLTPWRLDNIYVTNLQSAYQTGRYKQMLEMADHRPYWQYNAVRDLRTRPLHAAQHGKVYHFDHPFWDIWYPPNGFSCRCSVRTLTADQMRSKGLVEQISGSPFSPDEGFAYNPGREFWQPNPGRFAAQGGEIINTLAAPRDIRALSARLTQIRDGFKETGIAGSDPPIKIVLSNERSFGWARYHTGEIGLRGDVYSNVHWAVEAGEANTERRAGALRVLVHELGHHLGPSINSTRYRSDQAYLVLSQTINELWAQQNTEAVLRATGIRYDTKLSNSLSAYRTGYQPWVERLRTIFKELGMNDFEVREFVNRLNLTEMTEDFSKIVWDEVWNRGPKLTARGDFGEVILKPKRFHWLIAAIRSS